jgi:uncharacterized protein (TIGR00251 family)
MHECCNIHGDSIHITIKALPGASKTEFAGIKDGRLRVKVAAAPEGGKANAELHSFLAKALGCPARDIVLLRGEKSRLKTLALPLTCEVKLEKILAGK